MPFFIVTLCVGLGGLLLMALPGFRRHGRAGHARVRGHAARGRAQATALHGKVGARAALPRHAAGHGAKGAKGAPAPQHGTAARRAPAAQPVAVPSHSVADMLLRYMPEPRVIFSVLALFGAFGNVLQRFRLPFWMAALAAAAIAVLLEWLLVGRLWRLALKFTGEPTSPLTSLVMDRAEAVTAFRNGKGIVRAVIDGRAIQLTAELTSEDSKLPVRVGDEVTIQEVDSDHERVRVSVR
jgi:hypothetical protein